MSYRDGRTKHKLHQIWRGLVARSFNPKTTSYKHYGGKGIILCLEWCDFWAFVRDVEPLQGKAREGLRINRIDNALGYQPGNIRFVDAKTSTRNRGVTKKIDGVPLGELAEKAGVGYGVVQTRLRNGWSLERALSPVIDKNVYCEGVSATEISKTYGLKKITVLKRIQKGWSLDEVIRPVV